MDTIVQQGYNVADVVVAIVLILGFMIGRDKGVINMAVNTAHSVASFGASMFFYPLVSGIIRQTSLFDMVKSGVANTLGLESRVQVYTKQQEVSLISSLRLPEPLKDKLLENNNSVIYDLVGAQSIVDYITGFIANLIVNVVLVWVLFAVFMFLLRIVLRSIKSLSRLPVISTFNRVGGGAVGLVLAVVCIWISFTVIYVFIAKPTVYDLYEYISASKVAVVFYEHNPILELILKRLF
jgi:hypothetical protein